MQLLLFVVSLLLVALSSSLLFVSAAPAEDFVPKLPGYQYNSTHELPSSWYAGYVNNGRRGFIHYLWQFPENSSVNPADAPVITFFNGGPLCNSLEGAFYELGSMQFFLRNVSHPKNSTDAPFAKNPYSWNKNSHCFWLQQPAGVGYSYAYNESDLEWDDDSAANATFFAIKELFTKKFPEYAHNALFLSGESYAGIYVPLQSLRIMNYLDSYTNNNQQPPLFRNFKGIFVGNGVTSPYDNMAQYSNYLYARGHGIATQSMYDAAYRDCNANPSSLACDNHWDTFFPADMDIYDNTGWCYNPNSVSSSFGDKSSNRHDRRHFFVRGGGVDDKKEIQKALEKMKQKQQQKETTTATAKRERKATSTSSSKTPLQFEPYPMTSLCTDEHFGDIYLNRPDVRKALHAKPGLLWSVCFTGNYKKTIKSVVHIWEKLRKRNLVAVIYNGNADVIVPYCGSYAWIAHDTNWRQIGSWKPFSIVRDDRPEYGKQLAGWSMKFGDTDPNNNVVWFVSIHNAGHMVPQTQPQVALDMLDRILTSKFWPESTPTNQEFRAIITTGDDNSNQAAGKYIFIGVAISIGFAILIIITIILLGGMKKGDGGSSSSSRRSAINNEQEIQEVDVLPTSEYSAPEQA